MADKPSPHASDRELMDELEKRERIQAEARQQQGKKLRWIVLALAGIAVVVFFSLRENRELVSRLVHGTPEPERPVPAAPAPSLLKGVDPTDAQLVREVVGFMHTPEPPKPPAEAPAAK